MKMEMSLDLASDQQKRKQARLNEMLATPDLGLFMLASPDLERFIIQQNGLVLTTPTPTTQILFPKSVTEEQEAYARGFVDALGELHKSYGAPMIPVPSANGTQPVALTSLVRSSGGAQPMVTMTTGVKSAVRSSTFPTTTTMLPGSVLLHSVPQGETSKQMTRVINPNAILFQPKVEAAQTVPTLRNTLPPTTITPINLDEQESAKLDRKRARNRLAATRCRNRKLERISRLEERVSELKGRNTELAETAAMLREQVNKLKQNITEHTQHGCQVMLSHSLI